MKTLISYKKHLAKFDHPRNLSPYGGWKDFFKELGKLFSGSRKNKSESCCTKNFEEAKEKQIVRALNMGNGFYR